MRETNGRQCLFRRQCPRKCNLCQNILSLSITTPKNDEFINSDQMNKCILNDYYGIDPGLCGLIPTSDDNGARDYQFFWI